MVTQGQKKRRDTGERLAKRLVAEGRIERHVAEQALERRAADGVRFEEALIECGVAEEQLLRHLAELYRVQYISTPKLSHAVVNKRVVQLVPRQIAEKHQVVPVMLDRKNSVLSVVTADPDDVEAMKELEIATQVRNIKALIARPAAVKAAIAKYYDDDDLAFALLTSSKIEATGRIERDPIAQVTDGRMSNEYAVFGSTISFDEHGNRISDDHQSAASTPDSGLLPAVPSGPVHSSSPARAAQYSGGTHSPTYSRGALPVPYPHAAVPSGAPGYIAPPASVPIAYPYGARAPNPAQPHVPPERTATGSLTPSVAPATARSMRVQRPPPPPLTPPPPAPDPPPPRRIESEPAEMLDDAEFEELPIPSAPPPLEEPPPFSAPVFPDRSPMTPPVVPSRPRDEQSGAKRIADRPSQPDRDRPSANPGRQTVPGAKLESIGEPFQLAVVLISLLEGNRKDLRGHSIQTARLVRKVCERFSVPGSRSRAAEIAALIHDVGKASGSYHLTPFNVAQFDGHRIAAEKLHATPARVLESARLAKAALNAVTHMYERYDGKGFPAQLTANDIPLESRILAICDSYTDLTNNPRNSFRRVLSAQEACEALREKQGTVFDPKVIDRFARVVLGDELSQQLRSDRGTVLLVDPDVEETTVLELALLEKRYDVRIARSAEEALDFIESGAGIDLVLSELNLSGGSGFTLLESVRKLPNADSIAFVFLSQENDSQKVTEALDAGASDYLFKPLASQVVVAKVRHLLEQSHKRREVRGVSGSLEEMSLPDIVQVLHQGRKTGALKVSSDGTTGIVYFKEGTIVDAVWGDERGEEAFYAMVCVAKGGFTIDPEATPPEATINVSPEMLLLEGMRRLDEAGR